MVTQFQERLKIGDTGESQVKQFILRNWPYLVLQASKISDGLHAGARIYAPSPFANSSLIVPDFFMVLQSGRGTVHNLPSVFFADIKLKRKASYYKVNRRWQTGIDKKYREQYLQVERQTGIPVWMFHLVLPTPQEAIQSQAVPPAYLPAPTGLYGCPVAQKESDSHRGMVYWGIEDMLYLATLEDVYQSAQAEEDDVFDCINF